MITRFDPKTGAMRDLRYFDREGQEKPLLNLVGHCNSMEIYTDASGQKYLFAATALNPSKNANAHCISFF